LIATFMLSLIFRRRIIQERRKWRIVSSHFQLFLFFV
jgi:hypothetical protein